MSAFDDIPRHDIEPASRIIGKYDYLNNSGRPEAARVRELVDQMLSRYPEPQDELVRRLKSRNDTLHDGAAFELVVHEVLIRQGFEIIEVEPELPNGRAPDFLVGQPDGGQFYLECTVAHGPRGADAGAQKRLQDALQAIDEVQSPDFFLSVRPRGVPADPVPLGQLQQRVQTFVNGLDFETVKADFEEARPLPLLRYAHAGLDIHIEAVPKRFRGRPGRAIGHQMMAGGIVTPHEAIRASVQGKAGRYGQLDKPFVVAVNAVGEWANEENALEAAFGTEAIVVPAAGCPRAVRNPDGFWHGARGPQYTRLSAILSTERLSFWSLGQRTSRLIFNPWAALPLANEGWRTKTIAVENDRLVTQPGLSIREILGLNEGWPE